MLCLYYVSIYLKYLTSGGAVPGPRGSTSKSTMPSFFALSALTLLPVSSRSRAVGTEVSLGSRWVPPLPGRRPSITSGSPSEVFLSFTATL